MIEHAALDTETSESGLRRDHCFPSSWGRPPSDPEARDTWLKTHVRLDELRMRAGEYVPSMGRRPQNLINELEAKRHGPLPVAMDPRESWIRRAIGLRARIDARRRLEAINARRRGPI